MNATETGHHHPDATSLTVATALSQCETSKVVEVWELHQSQAHPVNLERGKVTHRSRSDLDLTRLSVENIQS